MSDSPGMSNCSNTSQGSLNFMECNGEEFRWLLTLQQWEDVRFWTISFKRFVICSGCRCTSHGCTGRSLFLLSSFSWLHSWYVPLVKDQRTTKYCSSKNTYSTVQLSNTLFYLKKPILDFAGRIVWSHIKAKGKYCIVKNFDWIKQSSSNLYFPVISLILAMDCCSPSNSAP